MATAAKTQNRYDSKTNNVLAVVESKNSIFDVDNPASAANSGVYNGFADILASIEQQDRAVAASRDRALQA